MEGKEGPSLRQDRVAGRPGASGVAERRRRLYQRHLFLFLAVAGGLGALDYFVLAPGLDFVHFLLFPWFLLLLVHTLGLMSRGYSVIELLIPPRRPPVREVYDTPLDYELVRSRQLRDGVVSAAAAIRQLHGEFVDRAITAADELAAAVEQAVADARRADQGTDEPGAELAPRIQEALTDLDRLHSEIIRVEVHGGDPDPAAVEAIEEQTEDIRPHT